jgi:hypothetical protein
MSNKANRPVRARQFPSLADLWPPPGWQGADRPREFSRSAIRRWLREGSDRIRGSHTFAQVLKDRTPGPTYRSLADKAADVWVHNATLLHGWVSARIDTAPLADRGKLTPILDDLARFLGDLGRPIREARASVTMNQQKDEIEVTEGPIPPDSFRWQGSEVERLSKDQWRLLDALCEQGRLRKAVPVSEVIRHVYESDRRRKKSADALRRALMEMRRRTQDKLNDAEVPLEIQQVNDSLRLYPLVTPFK